MENLKPFWLLSLGLMKKLELFTGGFRTEAAKVKPVPQLLQLLLLLEVLELRCCVVLLLPRSGQGPLSLTVSGVGA